MNLGLGTWQNKEGTCTKSVETAIELGYRHIDTAQIYENEEEVGKGLKNAKIDREEIFLASKVWIDQLSSEEVISSTEENLDKLKTNYIDLMYVHWPAGDYNPEESLESLKKLKDRDLINKIGVSNFEPSHLKQALEIVNVYANQVEMHPLLPQEELREFCESNDVELVAYSPLARGKVFDVEEIQEVAEKHNVSEAQVSLAWIMEKGATPIPKASSREHLKDNFKSLSLKLNEEDIEKIDSINRRERMVDPDFAPWR